MGAKVGKCAYKGLVYYPDTKYVPGPSSDTVRIGEVVHNFHILPPGCSVGKQPDGFYWWAQVEFVPWRDDTLVVSMGGYVQRAGLSPLSATHLYQGRVYRCTLRPDHTTLYQSLRRSESSALPNVNVHPGGSCVAYAGKGQFVISNMTTGSNSLMEKPIDRISSYKKGTFSPNGHSIAIIAKCSQIVELILCRLDHGEIIENDYIKCHRYCQGFRGEESRCDLYECRYSLDSQLVAVGASHGRLFVVDTSLELVCCVCPGLVDRALDRMANERCFDFDPRYLHRMLAVGSEGNCVYICDLNEKTIVKEQHLEMEGHMECLKYSRRGHCLAVAFSNGEILVLEPSSALCLYSLSAAALPMSLALCQVNGALARPLYMSFDTFSQRLAVSYTDGLVRVWQLKPFIHLQHLCKTVILTFVHLRDLGSLPLPKKIISEIFPLDPLP